MLPWLLALPLLSPAASAGAWRGTLGVDWTPLGRADLAWVDAGQLSGTLVAPTDGMLAPPLALHGGLSTATDALLLDLGLARVGTTTRSYDTTGALASESSSSAMGLKLGADYRRYLGHRVLPASGAPARAVPFGQVGLYGVIPAARRADTLWTAEEQTAQDSAAGADRAAIGALGARLGGGGEVCWDVGLCAGMRGFFVIQRGQEVADGSTTASTLLSFEPALSFDLLF